MTLPNPCLYALAVVMIASGCSQTGNQTSASIASSASTVIAQATSSAVIQVTPGISHPGDGVIFGPRWYALEHYKGETFHWARNDAEITACPDATHRTLMMLIAPGPSIGSKTAHVTIAGNRGDGTTVNLGGRKEVKVDLAADAPETFSIHVLSRNLKAPHGDLRTLNYRVLLAAVGSSILDCKNDITRDGTLGIGTGWYAYETYRGQTFRWVNNNAKVVVTSAHSAPFAIELDVQPGPSLGGAPLVLALSNAAGRVLGRSAPIRTRQALDFIVPSQSAGSQLTVSTASKDAPAPRDSRTLNFQVFDLWVKP